LITSFDIGGVTRLLVDTAAATEVAAVGVWYALGSRDESEGQVGSTHFIEHMLFKGTPSRNSYEIACEVDRLGGSINAFTERECMALHITVPSDAFESAAAVLIDLISNSIFEENEIEKERTVIANEIEAADDEPEEVASDAFQAHIWPSHPVSRKIAGDLKDLNKLSPELLNNRYNEYFNNRPYVISVAGDVDPERAYKAFSCLTEKKNNGLKLEQSPSVLPIAPIRQVPNFSPEGPSYVPAPFQHIQLFCAFGSEYIEEKDYYSLELANAAIGDSMSSRLFQELREKSGLCYTVYSSPSLLSDSSLWTAYATCSKENTGELVKRMNQEIMRLKRNGLFADEVENAKAHIIGSMKIAASDMEYRMRRLARRALYGGPVLSHTEALQKIINLTVADANRAIGLFLKNDPVYFAVGPLSAKSSFKKALAQAKESTYVK